LGLRGVGSLSEWGNTGLLVRLSLPCVPFRHKGRCVARDNPSCQSCTMPHIRTLIDCCSMDGPLSVAAVDMCYKPRPMLLITSTMLCCTSRACEFRLYMYKIWSLQMVTCMLIIICKTSLCMSALQLIAATRDAS
jgi:hypothetical protein